MPTGVGNVYRTEVCDLSSTTPPAMPPSPVLLSQRLRDATRDDHRRAERSPLMRDLLGGHLSRRDYTLLLRSLRAVYAALEGAFDGLGDDPSLARFAPPALRRTAALDADLEALHGPGWREGLDLPEAARAYAAYLEDLAGTAPRLLVAHAYVRYLGDLSGGRAIGRIVAERYGLAGGPGVAFHHFADIDDPARFKEAYRRALDDLGRSGPVDDLVAEARRAFDRNRAVFDGVDAVRHDRP